MFDDPSPSLAIPHAEIREAQDRTWTERLLACLVEKDLAPAERDKITCVHLALREACRKLGLDGSRGVAALREVDNADVQGALALAP